MISNDQNHPTFDELLANAPDAPQPPVSLALQTVVSSGEKTMSSLLIAEITGKPHRNVTGDIERILKEVEIDAQGFLHIYIDSQNRQQKCYMLPRRECDLIVSGYSSKYRLAIIDRWTELEAKQAAPVALPGYAESLRQLADSLDRNAALEIKIEADAHKVDFHDAVVASPTVCQMAVAGQTAGLPFGRNILLQKLRAMGVLISGGERHNLPKQEYVRQGLFTVKEYKIENTRTGEPIITFTTHVTQKGIDWLIRTFKPQQAKP